MTLFDLEQTPEAERRAAPERIRALVASPLLRVVAIATTGLRNAAPVAVTVLGPGGVPLLDTLVYTDTPIEADAQVIHGIRQDQLRGAPALSAVMAPLGDLAGPACQVVTFTPDWTVRMLAGACAREGAEAFNMSHWQDGRALLSPVRGTYNWTRGRWKPLSLAEAIGDLAVPGEFAPLGSATGNAQRLMWLLQHCAGPQEASPEDEVLSEASCPRCGAPESFCECARGTP